MGLKVDLLKKAQQELESMQEYLLSHGGSIEIVSVEGFNLFVRLQGACDTCPLSFYTITFGLEKKLKASIDPAVRVIILD